MVRKEEGGSLICNSLIIITHSKFEKPGGSHSPDPPLPLLTPPPPPRAHTLRPPLLIIDTIPLIFLLAQTTAADVVALTLFHVLHACMR